jgi:hypothetical protein
VQGSDEDPRFRSKRALHLAIAKRRRAIKDIIKSQGIPDFQAPPPIPKFLDTVEAIDEIPSYDSFEPVPDDF